ncbi:hypothetical protein J3P90_26220 (plasmid) [Pseudomonas sp. D3-10]
MTNSLTSYWHSRQLHMSTVLDGQI